MAMTLVRFSTQNLPPEARRDAVERIIAPHSEVGVDFLHDLPPTVTFGMRVLPGVQILAGTSCSFKCRITPGDDHFDLVFGQAGIGVVEHDSGRRMEFEPGTAFIASLDRAWTEVAPEPISFLCLALPREILVRGRVRPDTAGRDRLPPTAAMSLLQSYAAMVLREDMTLSAAEASRFTAHIHDLALLVLGAERREETERAQMRGLRAARLAAIKADIETHLFRPELSAGWIMARHRISGRYLRALFSDDRTTFTDFVRGRRLSHAMDRLTDPRRASKPVSAIAYEAGFNDLSWFNRAFRRHFGMTPSEARQTALPRALDGDA